ncbi:MAG TPA: hypothetical protein DCF68_07210 [Cyanothece sp. UBA12306]|nr:hypothetical protein [Cyanothece sp. UBA12306]
MLLNLINWLYLAFLCYTYGQGFLGIIQRWLPNNDDRKLSVFLIIITGLAVLGSITNYLSIIIPISWGANLIILGGAIGLFWLNYRLIIEQTESLREGLQKTPKFFLLLSIILGLLLVFQASVGPFHYDTGLYHSQAVQWIEKYKVVPGLGNLHYRFAYNSLLFPLASLVSFSFIFPPGLHSINGFILLICLLFSFSSIRHFIKNQYQFSHVIQFLIALPLIEMIYDENFKSVDVSSLSSDLPVSALTLVTTVLITQYIEHNQSQKNISYLVFILPLIITFIVCIKISALPLICWIVYLIYQELKQNRLKSVIIITGIILSLIIPQFIRNIILSGYLIYPLSNVDLFNVNWKIPQEIADLDRSNIKKWAIMLATKGEKPLDQDLSTWIPLWLQSNLSSNIALKFLISSIIIFVLSLLIWLRDILLYLKRFFPVYLTLIIATTFWFMTAPLVRYGYGFVTALSVIFVAPCFSLLSSQITKSVKLTKIIVFAYGCLILVVSLNNVSFYSSDIAYLIRPMDYPKVKVEDVAVSETIIYRPIEGIQGNDQCWNSAFPCSPYIVPQLQMRGKSLSQGFMVKSQRFE